MTASSARSSAPSSATCRGPTRTTTPSATATGPSASASISSTASSMRSAPRAGAGARGAPSGARASETRSSPPRTFPAISAPTGSRLETRNRKARGGFIGNLTSFLAVNGLALVHQPDLRRPHFHWAAIVSAAWGIGVVSSAVAAKRAGEKLREIDAMPDLDARAARRLQEAQSGPRTRSPSTGPRP